MTRCFLASLVLAGSLCAAPALAAGLKIAVVAPQEGPFATLGRQMVDGARFQAGDRGSEVVVVPETCEATDSEALAKAIIATGAEAAIGFLCTESLEAALPAMAEAGLPAITLSVRSGILMEDALKNKWPFFRLVPSAKMEADKITEIILSRWRDEPLALIDDGTIHGRELVESVRAALGEVGLTPVFTDTYRPSQDQQISLVRRLARSGATHVFVGGDRSDIAIIARDATAEKTPLILMGGEVLDAADQPVPLADGVLAVALPDYAMTDAARPVSQSMTSAGQLPEGYVLPAYSAMSILEQAKDEAEKDDIKLPEALLKGPFQTPLGAIGFNHEHELAVNPYQLLQWDGSRFVSAPASGE